MAQNNQKRGFTIVEILVVVSIIAVLVAFLMVALRGSQDAAKNAKVNVKLKEIGQWMSLWSGENQDRVLPSQFDFNDEADAGASITVRRYEDAPDDNTNDSETRGQYQGTWADILWTNNNLHQTFGLRDRYDESDPNSALRWESDSPDDDIFEVYSSFSHPFRSTFNNTRGEETDYPGYFAANDFFDSRSDNDADGETSSMVDRYYTYAMLNSPGRSVYLVDSLVGETISDEAEPWDGIAFTGSGPISNDSLNEVGEVDFRYGDDCLMLMLDGSTRRVPRWTERGPMDPPPTGADLSLYGQGIRVHQLTRRKATP
ncbi:MAG: type II secretion system protein [Phycisphaerae bacterium]|nr:type II secretion system protein [Phycisphaerae bacterium]